MKPDPETHDPMRAADHAADEHERCLATLLLLQDGRPVAPEQAAWAQAFATAHPECRALLAELNANTAALAAAPRRRARRELASRVLAALAPSDADRGVLPLVRRLAVAASLALAATLFFALSDPAPLSADSGQQRRRHAADHFRSSAFGPQDLQAGLRRRLNDPEFGSVPAGTRPALAPAPAPATTLPGAAPQATPAADSAPADATSGRDGPR